MRPRSFQRWRGANVRSVARHAVMQAALRAPARGYALRHILQLLGVAVRNTFVLVLSRFCIACRHIGEGCSEKPVIASVVFRVVCISCCCLTCKDVHVSGEAGAHRARGSR